MTEKYSSLIICDFGHEWVPQLPIASSPLWPTNQITSGSFLWILNLRTKCLKLNKKWSKFLLFYMNFISVNSKLSRENIIYQRSLRFPPLQVPRRKFWAPCIINWWSLIVLFPILQLRLNLLIPKQRTSLTTFFIKQVWQMFEEYSKVHHLFWFQARHHSVLKPPS